MRSFFVTGTDTNIGKTTVTVALLQLLCAQNKRCIGLKPIASGGTRDAMGQCINEDARALQEASNVPCMLADVNPYVFETPVTPHIAAHLEGQTLSYVHTLDTLQKMLTHHSNDNVDYCLIEGVGGWAVPLELAPIQHTVAQSQDTIHSLTQSRLCEPYSTVAHLPKALHLPVILVVGLRLGCLNHALLTQAAIAQMNLHLAGWVGVHICPDFLESDRNIETLHFCLAAPCLGIIPYGHAHNAADFLSFKVLMESL